MSIEQNGEFRPFRQANPLTISNVIGAILDSPINCTRIRIGTLAEDGRTVILRQGTLEVNRADAQLGQRVVVHET